MKSLDKIFLLKVIFSLSLSFGVIYLSLSYSNWMLFWGFLNIPASEPFSDFKALNMDFMVGLKYRREKNLKSEYIRKGFVGKRPIKKGKIYNQEGKDIGHITSSNKSFNLNKFIGMGYVRKDNLKDNFEGKLEITSPTLTFWFVRLILINSSFLFT